MTYQRGDRIALVHTGDEHTRLVPGTAGTVTGYDARLGQLAVAWDDDSTVAMLLHDGDQVRPLDSPEARPESLPSGDGSIIEIIPGADGSYHVAIKSASGQPIVSRFPETTPRMLALVQEWACSPAPAARAAPSLRVFAEAVRCHAPPSRAFPQRAPSRSPPGSSTARSPAWTWAGGAAGGRSSS